MRKLKEIEGTDRLYRECPSFKSLKPSYQKFILEYLKDSNASRAAIAAGYSKKTSRQIGQQHLTKIDIRSAMDEVKRYLFAPDIADAQEIREFWTNIKRGDIGEVASWGENGMSFNSSSENMPKDKRQLIKKISVTERLSAKGDWTEVKTSVELHDPLKASELLARDLGMLKDKVELTGEGGSPINVGIQVIFVNSNGHEDS